LDHQFGNGVTMISRGWLFVCIALAHVPSSFADDLTRFEGRRKLMGVEFEIAVYAEKKSVAEAAISSAFDRIASIENCLSDYQNSSEVNRLCSNAPHSEFQDVSDDLWNAILASVEISEQSDGAFDITVGPYTRIWRYARSRKILPDQQAIREAGTAVGFRFIEMNRETKGIRLTKKGMRLDFGGIGKGYAADQALAILNGQGIKAALVNASGDIVVSGTPPEKEGWFVAVESVGDSEKSSTVCLKDRAIATSGDAYQFLEIDGKRYSHIVNPKTGMAITLPSQVTVIAPTATIADSVASAILVLGPEKGLQFAEATENVDAEFTYFEEDNPVAIVVATEGFDQYKR
jgi:FAD:protein FMN transferase